MNKNTNDMIITVIKLEISKLTKFIDKNEFTININTHNIQKNIYFIAGARIDSKKLNQIK